MSISIGQRPALTASESSSVVGRHRSNAKTAGQYAVQNFKLNYSSATQHCKQAALASSKTPTNQGLSHIKSRTSNTWTQGVATTAMTPQQSFLGLQNSHRTPCTFEMAEVMEFDSAALDNDSTAGKTDVMKNTRQPFQPSRIDPRDVFFTPAPVAQTIETFEMPQPQRAIFKNLQPGPELAAAKMPPPETDTK